MRAIFLSLVFAVALAGLAARTSGAARLKDLASIRGVRANQLIGYGLVVGLNGTGDDQQVYFTLRSVQLMLRRLGVQAANEASFDLRNLSLRNTAAVMVTAMLPPFARAGTTIDVTVSSLGNAESLAGGTLLMTPLRGVDLKVYALAQGPVSVGGGFSFTGRTGSSSRKNLSGVALVPRGAIVEREIPSQFMHKEVLTIALRHPDFTTARRVAEAINAKVGGELAAAADPATITVKVPKDYQKKGVQLVAELELLEVAPDSVARVIVNERTGTVVVGQQVTLTPVAISHGSLTLEIDERLRVSQPDAAFTRGKTRVVPESGVSVKEEASKLQVVAGTNINDVVKALNAVGASPRDLIAILQALEQAGAMPAELVVQ